MPAVGSMFCSHLRPWKIEESEIYKPEKCKVKAFILAYVDYFLYFLLKMPSKNGLFKQNCPQRNVVLAKSLPIMRLFYCNPAAHSAALKLRVLYKNVLFCSYFELNHVQL